MKYIQSFSPDDEPCGCCGRDVGTDDDFCLDCKAHVLPRQNTMSAWDRTYFAQNGVECPFREDER